MELLTVCPTYDQEKNKKQKFDVNIGDSEFGNLVVQWREQDIWLDFRRWKHYGLQNLTVISLIFLKSGSKWK